MTDWMALFIRKHARILTAALADAQPPEEPMKDLFEPKPTKPTKKTPPKPVPPLRPGVPGKSR